MITDVVQPVRWHQVANPVGEWLVWLYIVTKHPALADIKR